MAFVDDKDNNKNRFFANNAEGQVLTAVQGDFDGQSNRLTISKAFNNAVTRSGINVKAQHFFSANGQTIGSFGQLKDRDNVFTANFDINYTPISENYPGDAPDQYVVQAGDTLRTIASRIFGDASLWYIIAEENGLTEPDAALTAGTVLRITNNVVTLSNAAGSFKPFNASEALGDTTPTLPPPEPKKNRWGILGQIIVLIVAIVVAYFTGVWLGPVLGPVMGSAVGAAAGSAVSQGVAIALDMQDSFSWKAVGAAALSSLIAPGVPGSTEGWGAVIRGATSSAVNQGVNIALGLQEEFNWKAVAASAVAAPVAQWAGAKVSAAVGAAADEAAGKFVGGFTQQIINQVSYAAFSGGKLNWTQMAADAFGNALGNAIADKLPKPPSATRASSGGLSLDEDIEEGIASTQARNESELLGMRAPTLHNNPTSTIPSGVEESPDDRRSIESVTVTGKRIREGDDPGLDQWYFLNQNYRPYLTQQGQELVDDARYAAEANYRMVQRYGRTSPTALRTIGSTYDLFSDSSAGTGAANLALGYNGGPASLTEKIFGGAVGFAGGALEGLFRGSVGAAEFTWDVVGAGLYEMGAGEFFAPAYERYGATAAGLVDLASNPGVVVDAVGDYFSRVGNLYGVDPLSAGSLLGMPIGESVVPGVELGAIARGLRIGGEAAADVTKRVFSPNRAGAAFVDGEYRHSIVPRTNAEIYGAPMTRTVAEAKEILERIGHDPVMLSEYHFVKISDSEYEGMVASFGGKQFEAAYGRIAPRTTMVSFEQHIQSKVGNERRIPVWVREHVFESDEAIAQVLSHEIYEIEELRYEISRPVSRAIYNERIHSSRSGNLHHQATLEGDNMLRRFRQMLNGN